MAWSTRELARLAGTTVNTIRHYHRLGLLEVPDREDNGYKQYEVRHLVRLLRIRRLADLGVPLSQIGTVTTGDDTTLDALREIDADLAANIERLQRARADIAVILRDGAPADTPAGFESVASRLSEADSSIVHIYKRLYDDEALADLREMVDADEDDLSADIAGLPADADETTRIELAARLAPVIAQNMTAYPWITAPESHASTDARVTQETFIAAMVELYNPAQRDVLARASSLAHAQLRRESGADGDDA